MLKKLIGIFLFSLYLINPVAANAINLRIDSNDIPKVKIIIGTTNNRNLPNQTSNADIGEILNRVKRNLQSTDLFDVAQKEPVSSVIIGNVRAGNVGIGNVNNLSIETIPDFVRYNSAGVGMLLIVDANFNQIGDLQVKVRLWDVLDERQLFGKFYSANKGNYKKMASLISDEIFKAATGEKMGHFDSKITYIAESGGVLKRVKRVALVDFDGENLRYLTNGRDLVLTPIFARQKNEILFVRFFGEKPQIYSLDTVNALVRKVGGFRGTTFAPTINPANPNIIAFSVIDNGNSNIYQMNLFTNQTDRLTNTRSIDTTPSYSPDGQRIIFSSDRSGTEQIYMMNADGGSVRKIATDSGSYSKPMWSPDGKFIAFTRFKSGQFSIGITDIDGRNEKTLTSGYLVEGAKWSPSDRYIIYSRKNGSYGASSIPRLYVIDVLTGFEREIPTPKNEGATDPDWIMN